MSLRRNVLASFASQVYVALVGILLVPLYLRYMGAEAYGLVGFFAMLQAWFSVLDMGLTATLARETARHGGGAVDAPSYRRLVGVLEVLFLAVAVVGATALLTAAGYIASDWLRVSQLPDNEVLASIRLMAIAIAARWMAGLYRGVLSGRERLVWLGGFNAALATLRFVGVLPVLMFVGTAPTVFFGYQLAVAVLELVVLYVQARRCLPAVSPGAALPWAWAPVKSVLPFSLTIAFTSTVWIVVTQIDKLALSRILPLADYGYFTMAVLVAGGITILSGPVGSAIMPRMARLESQRAQARLIEIYRDATQLVSLIGGVSSITIAFRAESLLWAWTGDAELSRVAAPVLALYAIGNGLLAIAAFPYYLQYAKGDLRLHLVGNVVFVVLLIPAVIWAAAKHGAVGTAWVWLGMNALSLVAWLPAVHRKFAPGLNPGWYAQDIATIVVPVALALFAADAIVPATGSRTEQFAHLLLASLMGLAAGAAASSAVRQRVRRLLRLPGLQP